MKKCPNCDRDLSDGAIKCKYCDFGFSSENIQLPEVPSEEKSTRSITDKSQVLQNTKKCPFCAMDIPPEASVCPYCRKTTNRIIAAGESMMNTGKKITTFVISLIVIAAIVFCMISVLK